MEEKHVCPESGFAAKSGIFLRYNRTIVLVENFNFLEEGFNVEAEYCNLSYLPL